jgi:hypothetical protein
MLRSIGRLLLLVPLIVLVRPVRATCFSTFSQVASGNDHYILLPDGSRATTDSMVGRFWQAGAPTVNQGTCDESNWLWRCDSTCTVQSTGPVFYLDGEIAAMACTTSCPTGELVVLLEDRVTFGEFLVARVDESMSVFDYSRLNTDLTAIPIPRVRPYSYSYSTGVATVHIDDPAAGFYGLPGVSATGTITAIQILAYRGSPPPPDRASWTLLGRVPYTGGTTTAQVIPGDPCPSNDPRALLLAAALEFDGQVLTYYVSSPSTFSTCLPERYYGGGHIPETGSDALRLSRSASGSITLTWGASCVTPNEFSVYEGLLGNWTSHVPLTCGTPGNTATYAEPSGNAYYLVVPFSYNLNLPDVEGSYGLLSDGSERPPSSQPCTGIQAIVACP